MEILIIGNGFDLAHKLPTSYDNFLDFCKKVKAVFTFRETAKFDAFKRIHIDNWQIDESIKDRVVNAFKERIYERNFQENGQYIPEVSTSDKLFNELKDLLDNNIWLNYFLDRRFHLKKDWIDFESEISKVVKALESARFQIECGGSATNVESHEKEILESIRRASKHKLESFFNDIKAIDDFTLCLNDDLDRLIRALEIYLSEFVHNITITNKNIDIENLNPDHILSFNYSDTYERVYGIGKNIQYDYIHGKADATKNVKTCNMVLGIDEYLDDDRKDCDLEFLTFKKYYQRIYKSTGNAYLSWADTIQREYDEYIRKKQLSYIGQPDSLQSFPFQKRMYLETSEFDYPGHTVYIFGHSLDETDKDVLKRFICNDNVQTKIYYYRETEDDKRVLAKLIKNLVKVIGQEELIKRTGGLNKTIEFIPQSLN